MRAPAARHRRGDQYLTVRTDEEGRRLEKIKSYRQKRAAGAAGVPPRLQPSRLEEAIAMKSAKDKEKRPGGQKQYYRRKKVCKFCVERNRLHQLQRCETSFAIRSGGVQKIMPRRIIGCLFTAPAPVERCDQESAQYCALAFCN